MAEEDAALADIINAVHLLEPPDLHDQQMEAIIDAVQEIAVPEKYVRRGTLLLKHARAIKKERSQNRSVLPPHVLERLERLHQDFVVRQDELVDLSETKPVQIRIAGRYKCWPPSAILRFCWGLRARRRSALKPRTRIVKKQPASRHQSAPTTASSRILVYKVVCTVARDFR
jgi:hypothetical protein